MKVKNLKIREIFASNSQKTLEVELETEKGSVRSSVPIGTSRGRYEIFYLPTEAAVRKFQIIKRKFTVQEFSNQNEVDNLLKDTDKTSHFREIGGNLALAISSVFLKGFALENDKELYNFLSEEYKIKQKIPMPICNIIGGWKGQSDIQEFLLLPVHQKTFAESILKISEAYFETGELLKAADKNFNFGKNLESAWITNLYFEKILQIMRKVADENFLKIGLDFAASQLWDRNNYVYSNGEKLSHFEQLALVEKIARKFPVIYIEDPFHEDDFLSFSTLVSRLQPRIVCGDDLYSSRVKRLIYGLDKKATNAVIIKPNQVGTISDTIEFLNEAKRHNIVTVMSHRSGETEDTLICHLAVGLGCDYIKLGISGERTVKINEMIRIEEMIQQYL